MVVIIALCGTVWAQSVDFTSTITFGDSITNKVAPDDAGPHERIFEQNAPLSAQLTDYAFSNADSYEIRAQILAYRDDVTLRTAGKATFLGFQVGGADLMDNLDILTAAPPGDPTADAQVAQTIENIELAIGLLSAKHPDTVISMFTVPDVTLSPELYAVPTELRDNLRAHIEIINTALLPADALPNVVQTDIYALMHELEADPPVLRGVPLGMPPEFGAPSDFYGDSVHPSPVGYAIVANHVMEEINAELGTSLVLYTEDELADLAGIP